MNPFKKLAKQTAIYGLSSVVGRLLNYLLVPLYTRFFSPTDYGVVTELYAYVAFLIVLLTYGLETAFFNFSRKEKDKNSVYNTILISIITTSVFFVLVMFLNSSAISLWMGEGINENYIKYFAIIVSLDAISSIPFAKLREEERAIKFATIRLLGIFTNILLNIYFIIYMKKEGIEYIFISNLISSIITTILLFPEIIKAKLSFNIKLWKKIIFYAFPLLIAGLAGMTNETIDRILLKSLQSNTDFYHEIGLYGAFYKLSIIMILFIQTFRFAAEPFFFSQYGTKQDKKIYAEVMKYFVIIMTIIFLIVTTFYDFILKFLGEDYHDERGFFIVSILLLANLFLGIFFNLSIWYKLTGKTMFGAYLTIFGAIITLTLNYILIPIIGIEGSALATLGCYFSMVLASYFLGKKYFEIPYEKGRILLYIFVMIGTYLLSSTITINKKSETIPFSITPDDNISINSLFLLGFIIFVYILERTKRTTKT